ncbi:MAG: VTT domain-containing protein [Oscillospiraceae bacterium]
MKNIDTKRIMNYSGLILIIIAFVLVIMMQNDNIDEIRTPLNALDFKIEELSNIQQIYLNFKEWMYDFEASIQEFGNIGLMIVAMLLFYALKSFISVVPISATCLLSGVIFPFPIALLVNYLGLTLQISIKYLWGNKIGGGNISKILKRYPTILDFFEHDGKGNPWFLFVFRLVPSFPINPISQMYGDMKFDFKNYLLISLAGFTIKVVSFSLIGSNVYDPLSPKFITPIIIILFISGLLMLLVNAIITFTTKHSKGKYKTINSDKNNFIG